MSDKKFKVGDSVRYIGKDHLDCPEYYPAIGTVGKITGTLDDDPDCYVQWPKNSTGGNDEHWCSKDDIELIEDIHMTNREIWKMLKPKMEKNGLVSKANLIHVSADNYPNNEVKITKTYLEDDVHNAIALAYKVGYLRAMKGRPFKIGEKKRKGGHWEPVDPNNLPKEGTRVRYVRHIDDEMSTPFSKWTGIQIGEETIVLYDLTDFGVKNIHNKSEGNNRLSSYKHPDRFDMWVEDDE